ncbi:hypothetical protein C1H46_028169 [Malus baccata]|uniref:Myb/SANT-like domain-containing protein n=1 Tax=Malus baccata TaxID=106549 RepID=A0A540LJ03_MALBA|nr:hypothetical protein C1H46_028169 [Malus baccata]
MCEKERCDPKKIDWSQTMDQFFVELMLDEVRKGNKVGCTFKKKSWITMITCFNEKFGFQHGRAVLKNRYNVLRKHYSSVNILLDQKGFTWDETQQKVVADDPKPQCTDGVAANALGDMAVAESPLKKLKKEASVSMEKVTDVLNAIDILGDEKRARMFLALHPALRKKSLRRKLRP